MNNEAFIKSCLSESLECLQSFIESNPFAKIELAIDWMSQSIAKGNKIISCGNGGSMCDAMHFAEELSGRYRNDRPSLAAISISDPSHLTCVANDYGFEFIFSRFVEGIGKEGDVLLGISTSGNSQNVINAVEKAKEKGMKTIVLTGKNGGKLSQLADLEIRAPYSEYADRAQEIHIKIIHVLIVGIEKNLGF
ncbi:MAG: D-sedoheptulose 7-phosphate isomerase [Bacteroidetes bacterium]|nr:D-sedoheptulose 7-phosphate isomerase [Bacteroidota bacterium]